MRASDDLDVVEVSVPLMDPEGRLIECRGGTPPDSGCRMYVGTAAVDTRTTARSAVTVTGRPPAAQPRQRREGGVVSIGQGSTML